MWNPESSALESGVQLKESGIPLVIGSENPSSTDKDWNRVPGIEYLESGIRDVESRIPSYLGLPYMGRLGGRLVELLLLDPNTLQDTMFSF